MVTDAKIGAGEGAGQGRIVPCLWYESQAEDAARYYVSLFNDSGIDQVSHYTESISGVAGRPAGTVMVVNFHLPGISLLAMNGGPAFKLSPAVSLMINCDTQEQVDYYWENLASGGSTMECGWLTDKFGLTWQITWSEFQHRLKADPVRGEQMFLALLQMKKINIDALRQAYDR